ncbi:heavy metal-binding domain-containing protein [Caldiplasma sukawensis]
MQSEKVILVSTNYIAGYKIVKVIGTIWGTTVRSRGIGGNVMANLRALRGGEIKEYVQLLNESRNMALQRLMEEAKTVGANAVIDIKFDSADFAQTMTEIVAYGTAVVVEPSTENREAVSLQ